MNTSWQKALGDPRVFLGELPNFAERFEELAGVQNAEIGDIRNFLKSRNYRIADDPQVFVQSSERLPPSSARATANACALGAS